MAKKKKRSIGAFVKMLLGPKENPLATIMIRGKSKKQAKAKAARFRRAYLKNTSDASLRAQKIRAAREKFTKGKKNPKVTATVRFEAERGLFGFGKKKGKTVSASGEVTKGEANRILRALGR